MQQLHIYLFINAFIFTTLTIRCSLHRFVRSSPRQEVTSSLIGASSGDERVTCASRTSTTPGLSARVSPPVRQLSSAQPSPSTIATFQRWNATFCSADVSDVVLLHRGNVWSQGCEIDLRWVFFGWWETHPMTPKARAQLWQVNLTNKSDENPAQTWTETWTWSLAI